MQNFHYTFFIFSLSYPAKLNTIGAAFADSDSCFWEEGAQISVKLGFKCL